MSLAHTSEVLVSLPMYDWPEIRAATDIFWSGLARHLGISGTLSRSHPHDLLWRNPNLYFSQSCGYPLTHDFRGMLQYVATPHYHAEGCDGPYYSSFIFRGRHWRGASLQQARPAINALDSMSGMLALKLCFAKELHQAEFFQPALLTGSHLASLAAVQAGAADVCAVDSVCVALARKYRPEALHGLEEIARSPLVPGLPFVTRAGSVAKLRQGLKAAFIDPQLREARAELLLDDLSVLPEGSYDQILALEAGL